MTAKEIAAQKELADRAAVEQLRGKAHLKKIKDGMTSEAGQQFQPKIIQEALKKTSKRTK